VLGMGQAVFAIQWYRDRPRDDDEVRRRRLANDHFWTGQRGDLASGRSKFMDLATSTKQRSTTLAICGILQAAGCFALAAVVAIRSR